MRASISNQLKNSLQGLNISAELLDQAVQLATNDNLDLGCAVIERAAADKVRNPVLISLYLIVFSPSICAFFFLMIITEHKMIGTIFTGGAHNLDRLSIIKFKCEAYARSIKFRIQLLYVQSR